MNCSHDFSPLDTNYARWLPVFLKDMAKLPEVHPAVHDAFMEGMRVVQRDDKKCYCDIVLDMVAFTHIIKPQRASIFGEYTHMQLMPCLQSYMTESMSYFGSLVKSISGTQLICITSSSQQMLTLYSVSMPARRS